MDDDIQKKSAYSPFIALANQLEKYKQMLIACLAEFSDTDACTIATTVYDYIENWLTDDERVGLLADIQNLETISFDLEQNTIPEDEDRLRSIFKRQGHIYLQHLNKIQQDYGQLFKFNDQSDEFAKLSNILDTPAGWHNKYDMPINYKIDWLARCLSMRIKKNYNNIVIVTSRRGGTGTGKSTFSFELGTTIAEYNNIDFSVDKNVIITEKREDIYRSIQKDWVFGGIYIFDEVINQLFSRDFYKNAQTELLKLFTQTRFKGATIIFNLPELTEMDIIIREARVNIVVRVTERGTAIIDTPNLQPNAKAYQVQDAYYNKPILSPQSLTKHMEMFDLNRVMTINYLPISDSNAIWNTYNKRRQMSVEARKMELDIRKPKAHIKKREDMINVFIAELPKNTVGVNDKDIIKWNKINSYSLTPKNIANDISHNTNLSPADILKMDRYKNQVLDLRDPVIQSYVKKVRETMYGVKDAK